MYAINIKLHFAKQIENVVLYSQLYYIIATPEPANDVERLCVCCALFAEGLNVTQPFVVFP